MSLRLNTNRTLLSGRSAGMTLALAAIMLQPLVVITLPVLAVDSVDAPVITVKADTLNGWDIDSVGGNTSFIYDESAPFGDGAVEVATPTAAAYEMIYRATTDTETVLLKDINLSYTTKRVAGPDHAAPSYALYVDADGSASTASDQFYAIFEPAYNVSDRDFSQWNTWDITTVSKFWYSQGAPAGAVNYQPLTSVVEANPNASILYYVINQGTGNAGWVTRIDSIKTHDTIYDFEPAATVVPTNLTSTSATSQNISGGVTKTNFVRNSWSAVPGAISYNYEFSKPTGLATYATNTTNTFVQGAFHNSVSPDGEYAFRVQSVYPGGVKSGWSSFSKVTYDATAPVFSVTNIADGNVVGPNAAGKLVVRGNFNDLTSGANYIQTQLVYKGNDEGVATKHGAVQGGIFAEYDTANLESGSEYYLAVTATDVAGNVTERKIIDFVFDKTAPVAPTDLRWLNSAGQSVSMTKDASGAAAWDASQSSDADHYIYNYWNDIPNNRYKEASPYTVNVNGTRQPGVFNQGDGTHYFCVKAVDAVGNISPCSATFAVVYDATKPDAQLMSTNNTPTVGDKISITGWVENEKNIKTHWFEITRPDKTLYYEGPKNTSVKSHTFDLTVTMKGNYMVRYVASDQAGNRNDDPSYSQSLTLMIVALPPVSTDVTVTVPPAPAPIDSTDDVEQENAEGGVSGAPADIVQSPSTTGSSGTIAAFSTRLAGVLAVNDAVPADGAVVAPDTAEVADSTAVLATTDQNNQDDGEVLAATDDQTGSPYGMLGVVWYWWLAALTALAGLWWLIAARKRSHDK